MNLNLEAEQIEMLMKSFYTLTGIRFVLFDTDFHEIISYPKENCEFCQIMKNCSKTKRKCNYADRRSFEKSEKTNSVHIYKCHAGLVEATIPLYENEKNIGYLMFGQITDNLDKSNIYNKTDEFVNKYSINREALENSIEKITYKSIEEIEAAVKIMEACTSYIIYKELITPNNNKILESAKSYIESHLSDDIAIEDICKQLGIGRTRLYEIFRKELNIGISKYILRRRLHNAKKLLKTTELSIPQIAFKVGFSDYNYFSRVYKKHYGKSPKNYRVKN
jgi:YesN/AraC family two-component response regulator